MFGLFRKTECQKMRGMLSEYIDKRMSAIQQEGLEAHLRACQACRVELESLQSTVDLLHRVPLVPVPHSFTLTEVEPVRRPVALSVLRAATAVAALALVVLLLGDAFGYYGGTAPASVPSLAERSNKQLSSADKTSGAPEGEGANLEKTQTPSYAASASQTPVAGASQPPALALTPEVAAEEKAAQKEATVKEFGLSSWGGERIFGPLREAHVGLLGVVVVLAGATAFVDRQQRGRTTKRQGGRTKNA